MKLQLPNGNRVELPKHETLNDVMRVVNRLLKEFDDTLLDNPTSPKVIYFLNGLSNYIVWFKDEEMKNKHDKEVLSREKTSKMTKYDPHNIPFTSLGIEESAKYGIIDGDREV